GRDAREKAAGRIKGQAIIADNGSGITADVTAGPCRAPRRRRIGTERLDRQIGGDRWARGQSDGCPKREYWLTHNYPPNRPTVCLKIRRWHCGSKSKSVAADRWTRLNPRRPGRTRNLPAT